MRRRIVVVDDKSPLLRVTAVKILPPKVRAFSAYRLFQPCEYFQVTIRIHDLSGWQKVDQNWPLFIPKDCQHQLSHRTLPTGFDWSQSRAALWDPLQTLLLHLNLSDTNPTFITSHYSRQKRVILTHPCQIVSADFPPELFLCRCKQLRHQLRGNL